MNFHSPNTDTTLNRRSWFKRAGAALVGVTVGPVLSAAPNPTVTRKSSTASAKLHRPYTPKPGMNHGFDEGPF
jgi:hypothetical protein